jgi:hypothetical protein
LFLRAAFRLLPFLGAPLGFPGRLRLRSFNASAFGELALFGAPLVICLALSLGAPLGFGPSLTLRFALLLREAPRLCAAFGL